MLHDYDPDGPATSDGLFGLPIGPEDAAVVVVPVPWELTTSYGRGTCSGPDRILAGSHQVDLFVPDAPNAWRNGIALEPLDPQIAELHASLEADALAVVEEGGATTPALEAALARVNEGSDRLDALVHRKISALFDQGRIPGLIGGDHSVSFGAIRAAVERHPHVGVLHIDAHADLREAYMGFRGSHASVMYNALTRTPLERLVQVGIRDFGQAEYERIMAEDRIRAFSWDALTRKLCDGVRWSDLCNQIVGELPDDVWISLDIDGLEPTLCPSTGTPVPGGLSWDQALRLLRMLKEHGKRVVGFDLVEVGDGVYDGNVGARLLYQLAITALVTR